MLLSTTSSLENCVSLVDFKNSNFSDTWTTKNFTARTSSVAFSHRPRNPCQEKSHRGSSPKIFMSIKGSSVENFCSPTQSDRVSHTQRQTYTYKQENEHTHIALSDLFWNYLAMKIFSCVPVLSCIEIKLLFWIALPGPGGYLVYCWVGMWWLKNYGECHSYRWDIP